MPRGSRWSGESLSCESNGLFLGSKVSDFSNRPFQSTGAIRGSWLTLSRVWSQLFVDSDRNRTKRTIEQQ